MAVDATCLNTWYLIVKFLSHALIGAIDVEAFLAMELAGRALGMGELSDENF